MKARNLVLGVMIMWSGHVLFAQKAEVNPQESSIEWTGKKIGSKHTGTIQLKSGTFEIKDDRIVSGKFVVDMTTIRNTDLKEDSRERLEGHLKSDDFFGVENYPTATFVVTQSSTFNNGKAILTGEFTIKDKTESISFEVHRSGNTYTAEIEIDRSKFDVRYGSDTFFDNLGDRAIDNMFILGVELNVS
jgi:polyisoprenoid-binding protein YceI